MGVGGSCEQDTPCDFPAASYSSTATHPSLPQPASSLSPGHGQGHPKAKVRAFVTLGPHPVQHPALTAKAASSNITDTQHPLRPAHAPPTPMGYQSKAWGKGQPGQGGRPGPCLGSHLHTQSMGLASKEMQ